MLQEAHARLREGTDIVLGLVLTHGRKETAALLEGLPRIPEQEIEYHGKTLQEMDLDAILRRRPLEKRTISLRNSPFVLIILFLFKIIVR